MKVTVRAESTLIGNDMNNIYADKPLLITLILIIILVSLLFINIGNSNESIIGSWIAPVQQKMYSFAGNFSLAVRSIFKPNALSEENISLREQVAELKTELYEMEELKQENERLRESLNVKDSIGDYEYVTAKVIGKAPGGWFTEFTVNVGTADGIEEGMVVLTQDGLVGRITSVYSKYSKVMSIIEVSSGVPAMIERSRDYCVVSGRASEIGDEGTVMDISYTSASADIVPGDTVITSGHGGLYPKGLLIGTVMDMVSDSDEIYVASLVDFVHLEEVTIIKKVFEEVD